MRKIIIAAASENNVIGNRGEIPWYIKEDLDRFKHLTLGHPVIQGRRTYDSIVKRLGKPLPKRNNIIISRNMASREGVLVARTMEEALRFAEADRKDTYVIGGEEIYKMFMPIADRIELTRVHKNYEGDAFFPKINPKEWRFSRSLTTTNEAGIPFSFLTYERV